MAPAFDYIRDWDAQRIEKGYWHSFELPDGTVLEGVCSLEGLKRRLAQFPIPESLAGKRVLDIGAWDGWFSFELERRGAEVVAVDCWDNPRFHEMKALYGSKVDYRVMDMFELTPETVGRFDIVLFMGVLYHLKHPLLALERVCALSRDLVCVDSFILREEHLAGGDTNRAVLEFYDNDQMGGRIDNWFGPSLAALLGMCRVAGFARIELRSVLDYSACVACYRKWEPATGSVEGPHLYNALHMMDSGLNFRSTRDDYVSAWYHYEGELAHDDVKPEVSGYGVRCLSVTHLGNHLWQINFKLPPLERAGWHEVRVRLKDSLPGNAVRIAVDLPFEPGEVRLDGVYDGVTWKRGEVDLSKGSAVCFWVEGLPENADLNNVRAILAGRRLRMLYLEPPPETADPHKGRQANASLPSGLEPGRYPLVIQVGGRLAGETVLDVRS